MTTQLRLSTYEVSTPAEPPRPCDRVRAASSQRMFVVRSVTDEREETGRVVLDCIAMDTGSDAVLFWTEIDMCIRS